MNRLARIFAWRRRATVARTMATFVLTSSPPSVVISFGLSATRVTASGFEFQRDLQHLFSRSHLEVKVRRHAVAQKLYVKIVNVPAVPA